MNKTLVINAVGLTPDLIGEHTPALRAFRDAGSLAAVGGLLPAVTTSVQTTYLTGVMPSEHGIVGNGWYFKDEREIKFWRQCSDLVQSPRLWDVARERDSSFTCANSFWWYNMYSSVDYSITPRPMYPADGRKIPDIYTMPSGLREELQSELGAFPLFKFWGPATTRESTDWIADASIRLDQAHDPTLNLVYLPHLDYVLQREGPDGPNVARDLRALDDAVARLLRHFGDAHVIILSEYGISPVSRPIHLNRMLREKGLLATRIEMGLEMMDAGASDAFAVADHQIAHVYLNKEEVRADVEKSLLALPGVATVLSGVDRAEAGLDHDRAGDFVVLSEPDAWFTYYYWFDDQVAPDFARTVDIHRKPGYDPVELLVDPTLSAVKLRIASKLIRKKLGFRTLMDLISLDASLVKGSHGLLPDSPGNGACLMTNRAELLRADHIEATDVQGVILNHLG